MGWYGRQLKTYEKNGVTASMFYDADGLRTLKNVNGSKTEYQYVGDKLFYEKRGDGNSFYYFYDSYGKLSAIYHYVNGTRVPYHVVTNTQGDVMALYNWSGTKVAEYSYDAWGICSILSDSTSTGIATLNPFRYRSYYYDSDLGLYYLQSRYYDAEIGRFINADGTLNGNGDIMGFNMYAYCSNNPVMFSDPNGCGKIGDFFSSVWNRFKNWVGNTFGAGYSTSTTIYKYEENIIPDPSPITVTSGDTVSQTLTETGDSSKTISVYADYDVDNPINSSSAGINFNIEQLTLNANLALDDISLKASYNTNNITNSISIKGNVSDLKIGLEYSSTIQWDNSSQTTYTNVSFSGVALVAIYMLATTGQYYSYSPAYS